MVRTYSGLGNNNGNQHNEPCVIKRSPKVVLVVEPIIMDGVQAMIRTIIEEATRQLLQGDKRKIIAPVIKLVINGDHSEEEVDITGCSYVEFIASQPPNLSGEPTPVMLMEWIHEMEMIFEWCDCSNKWKTIFAARHLKTRVLSWWKQMASTMPKGKVRRMSWEHFVLQWKREY